MQGGEQGGITWIELYALYMCKGAGERKKQSHRDDPLKPQESLQKALTAFKSDAESCEGIVWTKEMSII